MSPPINPPTVSKEIAEELPAYLSNGLIGLRVRTRPLSAGVAIVSGFSGRHATTQVEAAARAPYPVAGDIELDGVWMSDAPDRVTFRDQAYDFSCGELTTRLEYRQGSVTAFVEVLAFCSRREPTIVCQEVTVRTSAAATVTLRGSVTPEGVPGDWLRRDTATPGEPKPAVDGSLLWASLGGLSQVGIAYVTELIGDDRAQVARQEWGEDQPLASDYRLQARAGQQVRLRQVVSLVPSVMHREPDRQAVRAAARAAELGWDRLRAENRSAWDELWKGRIHLIGADRRWQELSDAAFFYLNSSVHPSSPSSTSIFGLAQWHTYHYYYGHVMWDVDTFAVPPLTLLQPEAARALLEFRTRSLEAAHRNASLHGREGYQFPWEASMSEGEEAAPGGGKASWYEDHVTLDVAMAYIRFGHLTGDGEFIRTQMWPVLHGICSWIESRVTRTDRGTEIRRAMGIAERTAPSDNEAFTNMSATVVLEETIALATRLGYVVPASWREMAATMVIPSDAAGTHVTSYDGWQPNHEKGATPTPLAALFPHWYPGGDREAATLRRYLDLAADYIGSPMLSALYGVWAAWAGDRKLSARLFEEGYAQFDHGRFHQTLETRPDYEPMQPVAGPFFANLGGFLSGLLFGLPGVRPTADEPRTWPGRPVVLPAGWDAIEVERVWIRGEPLSLVARHGDKRARLVPDS